MPCRARLGVLLGFLLAIALSAAAIVRSDEPTAKTRPAAWAVKLNWPGLPNLFKINAGLYRGAQPTAEGIKDDHRSPREPYRRGHSRRLEDRLRAHPDEHLAS